jgi:hypothetical protein
MRKPYALLAWMLPLALHSADALAWGLYTHIYFAQLLIWAIPLADPRFRRAVRRFPRLLLAGACLPDVALFSSLTRAPALGVTHQWSMARRMLAAAGDDESRALAAGFTSHLLTDVVAHNYFVPAHERLWFDYPVFTHAAAEWAMDAHVAPQLYAYPAQLLHCHRNALVSYAAEQLGCAPRDARRALACLRNGEWLLRAARVPHAVRRGAAALDRRACRRFDYYARETASRLPQINRLIAGEAPVWQPETRRACTAHAHTPPLKFSAFGQPQPLPQDFF